MSAASWFNGLQRRSKIKTIEAQERYIQDEIRKERARLPKYERELAQLAGKLAKIMTKDPKECTTRDLRDRALFEQRIRKLEANIDRITSNELTTEFLCNSTEFYLQSLNKKTERLSRGTYVKAEPKSGTLDRFVHTTKQIGRADDLDTFMGLVYQRHARVHEATETSDLCKSCGGDIYIDRTAGVRTCKKCGLSKEEFIESERPSYVDQPHDNSYFCYKRINHFNENLNQIQAKESTNIPAEVMRFITAELHKMKLKDAKDITVKHMKRILKRLGFNKYCEHAPHIIAKLNGEKPPEISPDVEAELRRMFLQIQEPFAQVCPKTRKNFLSYSYVLHKMLELKGLDEYLKHFPLLKSREKLYAQDLIWKGICRILSWQFIPSV